MYVQFRSKTLSENMEKLEKLLSEDTQDVLGIRTLATYVLVNNVKSLYTSKSCLAQWFKTRLSAELVPYEETYKDDYLAFENAMARLQCMKPCEWTISDMNELGTRMANELKVIDGLYRTLVDRRLTIIDLRRAAAKSTLKAKHAKAIVTLKQAKAWIENGANKKVMLILGSVGA